MKTKKEISKFVQDELKRLKYGEKTIGIYSKCITDFWEYLKHKDLNSVTFADIRDYNDHLQSDRLGISPSVINQALHSLNVLYNKIWKKDFAINEIERPKRTRSNPDILTQEEVLGIIEATNNLQHKLLIAIAYSAGLDLFEVKNMKLADVDLRRDRIKIRDSKGKVSREMILAKYVKGIYAKHLKANKPKILVFESSQTGRAYGDTTIQRILGNQISKSQITKKVTFKTLKYSYVIHSMKQGRPLSFILNEIGLKSSFSLEFFSDIYNRDEKDKPFSPLDKITLKSEVEYPINIEYLENAIKTVSDKDEADYLREALMCMNAGSVRAGIIFAWNAAVINLRKKLMLHGLVTLNAALKKHFVNAKEIKKIEDFSYIKDSLLLLACQELAIIDKGEKDSLEDCLDTRNKCGHPGKYRPKSHKAASFLEEVITIVFT